MKLVSVIGLVSQIQNVWLGSLTFLQRPSSTALHPQLLLAGGYGLVL